MRWESGEGKRVEWRLFTACSGMSSERSAQDLNVWSVVQVEVSDASSEDAFKVDMCK